MRNSLKAIILGTVIGLTSCNENIYEFAGTIDNEKVFCWKNYLSYEERLSLEIIKKDGKKFIYKSEGIKLESVTVEKGEHSIVYKNDEVGREALQIAQKQFADYLAKILETKKKQALEDIQ